MRLHFLFAVYPVTEMIRLALEKNEKACLLNPSSTLPTHPGDHKPRLATWEGGEKSWEAPLPCSPVPGFDEAYLLKAPGLRVPGQPHLPAYSCDGFLQLVLVSHISHELLFLECLALVSCEGSGPPRRPWVGPG